MSSPEPSTSAMPATTTTTSAAEILVTPCTTYRENARLARCLLITYPGHVLHAEKALERLGGLQHVVDRHYSTGTLHCQMSNGVSDVDDPRIRSIAGILQHKGVIAHRAPASQSGHVTLLVRARRRKRTGAIDMHIVGYVHAKYEFRAMADYAYLPIRRVNGADGADDDDKVVVAECPTKRAKEEDVYEDLTSRLIPMDIGTALNWWSQSKAGTPDDPSGVEYSPSPLLSRYSFSSQYMLTTNTMSAEAIDKAVNDRSKRNRVSENSIGLCARASRKGHTIYVEGDEPEYPCEPKREAVVDADHRVKDDRMHHRLIQLFDKQRPIWTRAALHFQAKCSDQVLKILLPKYAFYISSGPFGRLWCRFGYDPRTADPKDARLYQIVGVTFRRDARLVSEMPAGRLAFGTTSSGQPAKQHAEPVARSQKTEAVYVYRSGVRPVARQVWYCLLDIHLPIVSNILDAAPTKYNARLGFLPAGMIDKIRTCIKEDLRASCSLPADQGDEDDDDDGMSPA